MIVDDPTAYEVLQGMLRKIREDAGLTQYELADALGVPQSVISKIESGERRVDVVELRAICRVCGVELVDMVRSFAEAQAQDR